MSGISWQRRKWHGGGVAQWLAAAAKSKIGVSHAENGKWLNISGGMCLMKWRLANLSIIYGEIFSKYLNGAEIICLSGAQYNIETYNVAGNLSWL